jgi:mannose/cellobiose epimerase-like protein (N-acyl-D-glucosamine 2-epimerase family)
MTPDFRCRATLVAHIEHTLAFYAPRNLDATGGFFHFYKDDGRVYDRSTRHLVSSTRFVFNHAMAYRGFGRTEDLAKVRHGLVFLREVHRDAGTGGYAWLLRWDAGTKTVLDGTNHCYGLAFVLLACAHGLMAGVEEARGWLHETFELMEQRFWEPAHGLYADEASADWSQLAPYRGQNANMHACEALLAAFEATGETRYLQRAALLAFNITQRQASLAGGLVWEHYHADWRVDWDYNRDDKSNIFRPWGYQPGHLTEWAKLLVLLERHAARLKDTDWLLPTAQRFFNTAIQRAWDDVHGGLHYGFGPEAENFAICDADKYFWVQAESLAAAALLAHRIGEARHWVDYERLWAYSWAHFVDHEHGAWYRILSPDNRKLTDEKSPAGKTDYHTMGACWDVLKVLP